MKDKQAKDLINQVSEISITSAHTVYMLHAKLLEHQATLKMANKFAPNHKPESTVPASTVSTSTDPDLTVSTSTTIEKVKKEPEEVKEDEEEATSTELLMVPLMATK